MLNRLHPVLALLLLVMAPALPARAQMEERQDCVRRSSLDIDPPEAGCKIVNSPTLEPFQQVPVYSHEDIPGCEDSPENSTLVLACLAAFAAGTAALRRRGVSRRRSRPFSP